MNFTEQLLSVKKLEQIRSDDNLMLVDDKKSSDESSGIV